MSWLDALKKQVLEHVGSSSGADAPVDPAAHSGMFDHAVELLRNQGLGNLMKTFEAKGLKDIFASWVGKGANLPISVDQLKHVLGGETLESIATKLGLPAGQTAALLTKILPGMVDKMTPDGTITEPPAAGAEAAPGEEASSPASF
jgi:uncharacterized protein YidB (DUF937 family)